MENLVLLAAPFALTPWTATEIVQAFQASIQLIYENSKRRATCDAGLCSVEVDCFAVGKDCLVGHNQEDLQAHQTLQAGFVAPLLT